MKKKTMLLLTICLILVVSFTACAAKGDQVIAPEGKTSSLNLYFINEEYILTGNESLGKLMKPIEWELSSTEGNQYMDAINVALRAVPDGHKGYETMINDNIQFHDVTVKDGTAFVDFQSKGLSGGSLEERLLVDQIVETLVASFKEVEQVQFLVDGEVVESLMGHMDMTQPFKSKI